MNQSVGFLYMGHLQVRKGNVIVSVMKRSNVAQIIALSLTDMEA